MKSSREWDEGNPMAGNQLMPSVPSLSSAPLQPPYSGSHSGPMSMSHPQNMNVAPLSSSGDSGLPVPASAHLSAAAAEMEIELIVRSNLLVEQQRRIFNLESELSQARNEVLRLRSVMIQNPHVPSSSSPSSSPLSDSLLPSPLSLSDTPLSGSSMPSSLPPLAAASSSSSSSSSSTSFPPLHPGHGLPRSAPLSMPYSSLPVSSDMPSYPPQPLPRPSSSIKHAPPSATLSGSPTASAPPAVGSSDKSSKNGKGLTRYWTAAEHQKFLEAVEKFGRKDVKAISNYVGTRNPTQVRTHAQKYFLKLGGPAGGPSGASSGAGGGAQHKKKKLRASASAAAGGPASKKKKVKDEEDDEEEEDGGEEEYDENGEGEDDDYNEEEEGGVEEAGLHQPPPHHHYPQQHNGYPPQAQAHQYHPSPSLQPQHSYPSSLPPQ